MKRKRRLSVLMFSILIGGGLLGGCYTDSYNTDPDVVFTVRKAATEYDYTLNKTFAMPDEVFDLSDYVDDPIDLEHKYDQQILNAVATHMADLGYTRIADPQSPEVDVLLAVGVVAQEHWYYGYYYWWDYWYGWWWYYPPVSTSISIPSGSLVIMMADQASADPVNKRKDVVWAAGMRGLYNNINFEKIVGGIDQAFEQSEYLRTGPAVPPVIDPEEPDAGLDGGGY